MNRKSKTLRDLEGQVIEYKETLYKQIPANNRKNCRSFYTEKCGEVIHKGVVNKYWVNGASLSHFITLNVNGENKRFNVSPGQRYINKDGVWVEYEEPEGGRYLVEYYYGTDYDSRKSVWVEAGNKIEAHTKMRDLYNDAHLYSSVHEEDLA